MQQQDPKSQIDMRSTQAPIVPGDGTADRAPLLPVMAVAAPAVRRHRPRGSAPSPGTHRTPGIRQVTHNGITWTDIVHPGEPEIQWLARSYGFHPLHLDDTLSKIQRPKIDDSEDYTFFVMHVPVYSKLVRITTPSEVDIFVGANFVITAHAGSLKPLVRMFDRCFEEPEFRASLMGRSTGYLLYQIVDKLVDYCFPILNKIDQNIEQVEEQIFEERQRQIIQEISIIRRDIIAFRRIVKPLIPVITSLERKQRPFLHEDTEEYFGDIADHLSKIWDTLEDYKEVIEGLSDTLNSLASNRINEILKVLTIISVLLLPLTLISGIMGMNVRLPLEAHPMAFGIILSMMLVVIITMLGFFRWRRWI